MATLHIARAGKVWQHRQSKSIFGRKLQLKDGESLSDYVMVDEAKVKEPPKQDKQDKQNTFNFKKGSGVIE